MKAALLAILFTFALACARKPEPPAGRVIVLRFENLSGDPALDWIGRGAARQIALQLKSAFAADSLQLAGERERAIAGGSTQILHGYVSRSGGRLRLHADLEDTASGKFAKSAESSGPAAAGLLPLANSVARQLDPEARPFGAKSEAALAAYIAGVEAPDLAAAAESFSRSFAADPDFGASYLALAELSLARKDRAAAERTLALARARGENINPIDRARLDVAAAQISGDRAALSKSLATLSRLTPNDAGLLRGLGDGELAAKRYPAAIGYYRQALAAQPGDGGLLNILGYAQAYAGDLDAAVQSLREYERARPNEANPLDSLGDVHFYWGRFSEAAEFYRQSYAKDAAFQNGASLFKAATARLFTGDASAGEALFAEYEAARRAAGDPLIEFSRGQWDYMRGKRAEAMRRLQSLASATHARETAALADCALTVWLLEAGDRAGAARHSACRFLTQPAGAPFPNPTTRLYALLLAKDFQTALPILRELATRAAPNPQEPAPVLLAWALVETGNIDEAGKYLRNTPVPPAPSPAPFESLIYPRIFYLRARVAEKKGDRPAAEHNDKLFRALSGLKM